MFYNVIGKNPNGGVTTTTTFGWAGGTVKFIIPGLGDLTLPITPSFSFGRTKTNLDFNFGDTQVVYYCDPCSSNNWSGPTYSTGSVRLRVREQD